MTTQDYGLTRLSHAEMRAIYSGLKAIENGYYSQTALDAIRSTMIKVTEAMTPRDEAAKARQFETMTAAVISTAHLTARTRDAIPEICEGAYKFIGKYGVILYVRPDDLGDVDHDEDPDEDDPDDIKTVKAWARANKFEWVRLDADADEVEGLATYPD